MDPIAAVLAVVALVAAVAAIGLVLRHRDGRLRSVAIADSGAPAAAGPAQRALTADAGRITGLAAAAEFGPAATIVQFSTPNCARCPGTARLLAAIAAERPGVSHLEIDLEQRPELAARFNVLQTPTVLLADGESRVRARLGGVPRRAELIAALDAVLAEEASRV